MITERPRVGVMGAGSIGCFVGGRLIDAGAEVVLVGRRRLGDEIAASGMSLIDLEHEPVTVAAERVRFETEPGALAGCDAVLCCVKSGQTAATASILDEVLGPKAAVVSLQNGVSNARVLRQRLGDRLVVAGIVGFNVVSKGGGVFHRGTTGPLMLGDGIAEIPAVLAALQATGLEIQTPADLERHQWTKLIINLNNAVSALSGAPSRELVLSPGYRRIVAALVGEALQVLSVASIKPAPLRGVPLRIMPAILRMPTPIVRLVTSRQMKFDPEARSSMWEDLERRRPTEVDHLNGEIVELADRAGVKAPLNRRIVELVHAAEQAASGSPGLDAGALWTALTESPRA